MFQNTLNYGFRLYLLANESRIMGEIVHLNNYARIWVKLLELNMMICNYNF